MPETMWTAAAVALSPGADERSALIEALEGMLWAAPELPVGLCLVVVTPGFDGRAARALLRARLPGAPIVALQAEAALVNGERVDQGLGLLIGQWAGPAALLRRLPSGRSVPPGAGGPLLLFAEHATPELERAVARCRGRVWGAAGPALLEPMGAPQGVVVELPALLSLELRHALGAGPVGPVMRAGAVEEGQIGLLDGVSASRTLSAIGARLPVEARERLRGQPLLLPAGGPRWAVGGAGEAVRVLGVHDGTGHLLIHGAIADGAAVQLGAPQLLALSPQLGARPLPPPAPRLALLSWGRLPFPGATEGLGRLELARLQAALGPAALFGLQAEAQVFGRAGRAAALRGGAALGLLTEPDWS